MTTTVIGDGKRRTKETKNKYNRQLTVAMTRFRK